MEGFCGFLSPSFYALTPLLVLSPTSQWPCISLVKNTNNGGPFVCITDDSDGGISRIFGFVRRRRGIVVD